MKNIFLFLILAISFSGAAILRFEDSCVKSESNPNPLDATSCYYKVALSYAVIGDRENAIRYCGKIVEGAGSIYSSEYGLKARCLGDISEKLMNKGICQYIEDEYKMEKNLCIAKAESAITKSDNRNNCSVLGLVAFTFFASLFFRNSVH